MLDTLVNGQCLPRERAWSCRSTGQSEGDESQGKVCVWWTAEKRLRSQHSSRIGKDDCDEEQRHASVLVCESGEESVWVRAEQERAGRHKEVNCAGKRERKGKDRHQSIEPTINCLLYFLLSNIWIW